MRARALCAPLCAAALAAAIGLVSTGCLDRDLKPLTPCTVSGVVEKVRVTSVDKVDLLFMVDNSNSMAEEQVSLAMQFPNLVRVLATGDINNDGTEEFPPVRSLQIGVVSSDMGTGGFRVPTCAEPNFGDDGILRTQGNTALPGCTATYPPFLGFRPADGGDPNAFAADVSCVAALGTGGCGFEQQLEAVLKAVTPSTSTIAFNMGTSGHADNSNMGFLRPDSLLAIIMVTDEEDCSAADPELFNPSSSIYTGDLNLRCFSFPAAVHPINRYVDGLLATRSSGDLLVFAAIAGVPPRLVETPETINFDAILADPDMQEMVDPTMPTRLRPSCNVPGRGLAFPPRRIVQVAQQLENAGSNGIIQSICQADFAPALNAIIEKIADVLGGACLPRQLNPDETGLVNCDVVEVLPPDGEFTSCDSIPGRVPHPETPTEVDDSGVTHNVCRVTQLASPGGMVPSGQGWYYDNFSTDVRERCGETDTDGQRISFTSGAEPKTGTEVRLECLQPVQQPGGAAILDIGSPCGSITGCGANETVGGAVCQRDLACEPITNTLQQPCSSDANCIPGWRCDTDAFCTNPTCGR